MDGEAAAAHRNDWDGHSLGQSQPAHTEGLMWALPASNLPEGKYPTHLLLGSICLSDP